MTDLNRPQEGYDIDLIVSQLALDLSASTTSVPQAANENDFSGAAIDEMFRVCHDGERTQHLTRLAGSYIGFGLNVKQAMALCAAWNRRNKPPLDSEKVRSTVANIARTHKRNHPPVVDNDTPLFDLNAASVSRYFDK